MAKNNPGDLLSCDWNPVIGCQRYSAGCRKCWYLDGIFGWQKRLGNIPVGVKPDDSYEFPARMKASYLKTKRGIVGICQHGDLFWDKVSDTTINNVLDIVDEAARPDTKYVLWSKRAARLASVLNSRYPHGVPDYLASAISIEDQKTAKFRLPELARISGVRIAMLEPMIGPIDLGPYINEIDWVVVGSETGGDDSTPLDLDWVRAVRDTAKNANKLFFIKQLGNNHKHSVRTLDGRTWDEFAPGFVK